MLDMFKMGGWGMLPTLICGVLTVGAALRYAAKPERRFVPLQISLGVLTMMAGGLGFVTGLIKSFSAMGGVTADQRWLWMIGTSESLHNVALALALLTLAAIASSVGSLRLAQLPEASAR